MERRRRRRRFVCAFKAQLCGIRFPLEANRDLGQQVYTIRMHNAQAAHVNCPLRPPHEVHPHQIGVIKFTYPAGACELSDSSFRFPLPPRRAHSSRCYANLPRSDTSIKIFSSCNFRPLIICRCILARDSIEISLESDGASLPAVTIFRNVMGLYPLFSGRDVNVDLSTINKKVSRENNSGNPPLVAHFLSNFVCAYVCTYRCTCV